MTLQYLRLTTGWRHAPTKTASCAEKWKTWNAQTSKNAHTDFIIHSFKTLLCLDISFLLKKICHLWGRCFPKGKLKIYLPGLEVFSEPVASFLSPSEAWRVHRCIRETPGEFCDFQMKCCLALGACVMHNHEAVLMSNGEDPFLCLQEKLALLRHSGCQKNAC